MKELINSVIPLEWDSNFLGYNVSKLEIQNVSQEVLQDLLNKAKFQNNKLVYVFTKESDVISIHSAKCLSLLMVDNKITYLTELSDSDANINLGKKNKSIEKIAYLNDEVISLALQSGEYSRFKTDNNFDTEIYKSLYTIWIEKSVNKAIAKEVLSYKFNGKDCGLLTLGIKNSRADIGLLAVDKTVRGQSIGRQLIDYAKNETREWGFRELQVVTQGNNRNACRFYEKNGFKVDDSEFIYHVWL